MEFGLWVTLLLLIVEISCIPLHQVNEFDMNGLQCPAKIAKNQACPTILCVRDVSLCPNGLEPLCPDNEKFCPDGVCRDSCIGIFDYCSCNRDFSWSPCLKYSSSVNITNYSASRASELLDLECSKQLNISSDSYYWSKEECDFSNAELTFVEPFFLPFYGIWTCLLAVVLIWILIKRTSEKNVESVFIGKCVDQRDGSTINSNDSDKQFDIQPYRAHSFGTFARVVLLLTVLGWVIGLTIITFDEYGFVYNGPWGLFHHSNELNAKVFCFFWHITAVTFVFMSFSWSHISTYFKLKCVAEDATCVRIDKVVESFVMLGNDSWLVRTVRRYESWLNRHFRCNTLITVCPILLTKSGQRYFEFQCARFVYQGKEDGFIPFITQERTIQSIRRVSVGLSSEEASTIMELIGPNFIHVKVPSLFSALGQEFRSYFYIYQMMVIWTYLIFNYYYIGFLQLFVIILSAFVKVVVKLSSEKRIKLIAEYKDTCNVFRDQEWTTICTTSLVPGDIIEIESGIHVPCDAVLLTGDVVVNESSLTGEPLPIRKFPLPSSSSDVVYNPHSSSGKKNALFAGTTVLQSSLVGGNFDQDEVGKRFNSHVVAIVLATGRSTDKGGLVTQILFPTPLSFIFDMHMKVVLCLLFIWGIWWFGWSMYLMGRGDIYSWFFGIFLVSEVINPLLPAALVVGQSVAATRLKKQDIFCIDFQRIIVAGKVKVFCFDKTGTLTKEGLEYFGVKGINSLGKFDSNISVDQDVSEMLQVGMGVCHSVTTVDGSLVGNPVDIEMFASTNWSIKPSDDPFFTDVLIPSIASEDETPYIPITYKVITRHEFQHARSSMSVLVQNSISRRCHVFVKGSFEKVKSVCTSSSVPINYDRIAEGFAKEGCYVLAMAMLDLGILSEKEILEYKSKSRDDFEAGVNLIGLVLFKNKLREDTKSAINQLKQGDCRVLMITGDNALTGIHIARGCDMLTSRYSRVILGDIVNPSVTKVIAKEKITDSVDNLMTWTDVETDELIDDIDLFLMKNSNTDIAITGPAFDYLLQTGKIGKYLFDIRIFARMTPVGKVSCVELYMEHGITAMCGDGGNDCGALRAAHVGVAMSEAEASIVAPFSTKNRSIMSCVEVLKEGRCALATSFASYKFLIIYGCIMVTLDMTQNYFTVVIAENSLIGIDSFITVLLSWAITLSKPANLLTKCRPTARLLGAQTVFSILGQFLVNVLFLFIAFISLYRQKFFLCNEFDSGGAHVEEWWLLADNFEAEVLVIVTMFQFINAAAIFNFGSKFRQHWIKNYTLVCFYVVEMVFVSFLTLAGPNPVSCFFRINCGSLEVLNELGYSPSNWTPPKYSTVLGHNVIPFHFRMHLLILCLFNCLINVVFEKMVIIGPVGEWLKRKVSLREKSDKLEIKL